MERRPNCFDYIFGNCTSPNCTFGHVIIEDKDKYMKKLRKFDPCVMMRTANTLSMVAVYKFTEKHQDWNLQMIKEYLEKLNSQKSGFYNRAITIENCNDSSDEEINDCNEEEEKMMESYYC